MGKFKGILIPAIIAIVVMVIIIMVFGGF